MKKPANYRPDIDGLRAIAVVAVVLYHLDIPGISGGFVGVDVFFVISGYLITGLVRREMADGRFTFRDFFLRRVRRLAAPLFLVTIAATVAAYFILWPGAVHSFAQSVLSQPVALQNFHFLATGEYFQIAETKPLLHTWSLGVEEQFYLVWPLLLFLFRRRLRSSVIWMTAGAMVASFGANLFLIVVLPKASFYLLPARAWELGFGAMLALIEERSPQRSPTRSGLHSMVAVAAIALLGISFTRISPEMAFPGWVAILPVAATTILIAHGSTAESFVKRALSSRGLVYLGLISYSLYLWHWPLITYTRLLGGSPSDPMTAVALITTSVLLAMGTRRFIETPIRQRRVLGSPRKLLVAAASVALLLIAAGSVGRITRGAAFRYAEPARSMLTASFDAQTDRCPLSFRLLHPTAAVCSVYDAPAPVDGVLLWGNSHADMWSGLFRTLGDRYDRSIFLNVRNCRPVTDSAYCGAGVQSSILEFIDSRSIGQVVLASNWYGANGRTDADLEEELETIVRQLAGRDLQVWLVVDVPASSLLDPVLRYKANPDAPVFESIPLSDFTPERDKQLALFQQLARSFPNVHLIDATDTLCFESHCYGGMGTDPWYFDGNHLTNTATLRAVDEFTPVFLGEHP